jgi:hypothetical protein
MREVLVLTKLASRNRLTGVGCKPPQAAWVKSPGRERCGKGAVQVSGENRRRRTTVNCRSSVESAQMTSKPGLYVIPGSAWRGPVYWPCGVRHRGSASLIWAPMLNCGNLRLRCKGKSTSPKGEADSTDAQPRGGATRSSVEVAVMVMERRDRVILSEECANCENRRSAIQ